MTESNILKNPLDSYFGHEIFDLNVEPSELETIANKLQVNLVHSILVNCCPKLSCDNEKNCNEEISNSKWGFIVLNSRIEEIVSFTKKKTFICQWKIFLFIQFFFQIINFVLIFFSFLLIFLYYRKIMRILPWIQISMYRKF